MSHVPSRFHRMVDTTDVDQAREEFGKMYTRATLEPSANLPFGFTLEVSLLGSVHLMSDCWSSGAKLATPALDERYILAFAKRGTAGGMHAGHEFAMVPGRRGALFSPKGHSFVNIEGTFRVDTITIDRAALEAHWANLTGETSHVPIRFAAEMDLTRSEGGAVYNVAQLLRREAERPEASRLVIAGLRDALFTTLLAGQLHNASGKLRAPAPRVAPGCVRRAEEYIAAHVTEPITLEDVVAAAGVPARSLYAAFESSRGTTPMAFLRDRRMELARQRLLRANASCSVVGVVRDLGLGNPGRFSATYKQRFGESPSETLARAIEREARNMSAG